MSFYPQFSNLPPSVARNIRQLRQKKYRIEQASFVVEGRKSIEALLGSPYTVQMLVGTPSFLATHSEGGIKKGAEIFQTDESTLASIGNFKTNVVGLAVATLLPNEGFEININERVLALDTLRDPGNLGTILRIADWYGIRKILCSDTTVDMYNPKTLQASMGSFTRGQVYYTDLPAYFQRCPALPIWGASLGGANVHEEGFHTPGGVLVIGNETHGISSKVNDYVTQMLSIPRFGCAESLNAAIAAAVLCDHWHRPSLTDCAVL